MTKIKESIIIRSKDIDRYLRTTKELLTSIKKLEKEFEFTRKNLKSTKEQLKKEQEWFINQNGI